MGLHGDSALPRVLTSKSVDEILKCNIQMKRNDEHHHVVQFMLYKVLPFQTVDEMLKCNI